MSHFTNVETGFQDLKYLEKALNFLNIKYQKEKNNNSSIKEIDNFNLIINQLNGHNIQFAWNGQEYDLVFDMSYWEQPYSIESFIDMVSQQYACETITNESQKIGFQPVEYQQNKDGSNTLVLERWNENNIGMLC